MNLEQHNKYKNIKTVINGIPFSSLMEAKVYQKLLNLQEEGQISDLILQPPFVLQEAFNEKYYDGKKERIFEGKIREVKYISDFEFKYKNKTFVLEVKGMMDQKYPIKKKLFLKKYGQDYIFMEIRRVRELENIINIMDNLL